MALDYTASPASFRNLIKDGMLYASIRLSPEESRDLVIALQVGFPIVFDTYCTKCRQESTYARQPSRQISWHSRPEGEQILAWLRENRMALPDRLEFVCARASNHRLIVNLLVETATRPLKINGLDFPAPDGLEITKIGQFPSVADIQIGSFSSYKKYVDPLDFAELKRASGLAAHGIGIGSFCYVRRVFERLIGTAKDRAVSKQTIDVEQYQRSRMDEKINLLHSELPQFIVANARIYSVLSKGIHQLSEKECLEMYPIVEAAILLMLDEVRAEAERTERLRAATLAISKLHSQQEEKSG